ncbi:MAG: hypothetical protein ACP5QZ_09830, partial [Candidatus Sumerlaeaceae bacterium]
MAPGAVKKLFRGTVIYLFILPALVPMLALVGVPLLQTIFFSFTNLKEKNFDLWTLGIEPIAGSTQCSRGVAVRVIPRGPAAKHGVPDGACALAIGEQDVSSTRVLERLLEKAKREFVNGKIESVTLTYL